MAASSSSSSTSSQVSARADTAPRKRPTVDLSLVDARLDELFASPEKDEERVSARADSEGGGTFQMLAHDRITVRPQVRQTFPTDEMAELAASIHELKAKEGGIEGSGILQALLVTPEGNGFRLVAGERRFRASQSEGVPLLPCVVVGDVSESAIRVLQLTENALRTPPPILEEARAIEAAMDEEKLSIRDMARLLGKDKSYVEVRVGLLRYPLDVQEMVSARADTLRHARHLAGVEDEEFRADLIAAVRDEGIGEREVKRRIQASLHPEEQQKEEAVSVASQTGEEASPSDSTSTGISSEGSSGASSKDGATSGTPSLRGALRATGDAIEQLRRAVLSQEERDKARVARDSLRSMLDELDEILG